MNDPVVQRLLRDLRELQARVYERCPIEDPDSLLWEILDEVRTIAERAERGEAPDAEEAA